MQIDWFTTVAQVVNFLVLLAVLKFVLFDRIVASIDTRRDEIKTDREQARESRDQAESERQTALALRSAIEENRESQLHEAKLAADEYRSELEQEVRHQSDRMRERFHASLRDQERQLISELIQTAAEGVTAAAERALEDLADSKLEARIVQHFCHNLAAATLEERQRLRDVWGQVTEPLIVRSHRELAEHQQSELQSVLRAALAVEDAAPSGIPIDFETSEDLACGLEISGAGHTVGWNIHSYLSALEARIQDALAEDAQRESAEAQEEAALAETATEVGANQGERERGEREQQTAR